MKTVVITGGTRGIGRACVELFAENGYNVVFGFQNSDALANEICEKYNNVISVKGDISTEIGNKALFDCALNNFGTVVAVVLNAGISHLGMLCDEGEDEYNRIFNTNFKSVFLGCKEASKIMVSNKSGAIVTVSSMWGQVGASCESLYSASKSAVIGFTKSIAKELAPSGIRVNCVCPGVIDTEMNAVLSPETLTELAEETPLGRLGTPKEVAEAIYFLASENSSFITGQILGVNGGMII